MAMPTGLSEEATNLCQQEKAGSNLSLLILSGVGEQHATAKRMKPGSHMSLPTSERRKPHARAYRVRRRSHESLLITLQICLLKAFQGT